MAASAWRAPLSGITKRLACCRTSIHRITKDGDTVTAALAGDFDMQATFTVEPALERALETPGLRRIELDLRGLDFIDSTGMVVIIRLDREAHGRGVQLRLRRKPRPVHRVFEKSGLAYALPFSSPDR
jgi:anti-anti-sigma factor